MLDPEDLGNPQIWDYPGSLYPGKAKEGIESEISLPSPSTLRTQSQTSPGLQMFKEQSSLRHTCHSRAFIFVASPGSLNNLYPLNR